MGNGTKVALVALLIVMVVVVARFVNSSSRRSSGSRKGDGVEATAGSKKGGKARATLVGSRSKAAESEARRSGEGEAEKDSARQVASARERTLPAPRPATSSRDARSRRGRAAADPSPRRGSFVPLRPLGRSTPGPDNRFPIRTRLSSSDDGSSPGAAVAQGADEETANRTDPMPSSRESGEPPMSITERNRQRAEGRLRSANIPTERRVTESGGATESGTTETGEAPGTTTLPPLGEKPSETSTPPSGPIVHELRKGESYWSLAKKYYDRGVLYPLIEEANRGIKLHPGNKVTIPALTGEQLAEQRKILLEQAARRRARSKAGSSESSSSRDTSSRGKGFFWYTAQRGDTLSGLAKRYYGNPAKFRLIEEANPEIKYTGLKAGDRIKIPGAK